MRAHAQSLMTELERQLENLHSQQQEPIVLAEQAIMLAISALEKLKSLAIKHKFKSKVEEIVFFRDIKPQFVSKLLFYNEMYNLETNIPFGAARVQRKFYKAELDKLKSFYDKNTEFYKYYRTGNRSLDSTYFLRGKYDLKWSLDSSYFQADHRFATSHDHKVAQILANDLIKEYLEKKLAQLESKNVVPNTSSTTSSQKWTGSKVALTELVYALHAEGVFNNGASELKEVATFIETSFQVDLGHFHRTFLDIRSRTSERTKFLNGLRDKLITRMDNADEY